MKPKTLIIAGYGLNCEEETQFAFERAGASATIVHINDLIDKYHSLRNYNILAIPGGFSYGDDTGSGNAFANKIKSTLWEQVLQFVQKDKLVIGICNGFQILVNLGLVPAINGAYGERQVAFVHNDNARYTVRWVDLQVKNNTPWLKNMTTLSLPIAHGEGKLYTPAPMLKQIKQKKLISLSFIKGTVCNYQDLPANPNGALENIAGITDETGRILGLMPHPERAIFFTQQPHWTLLKEEYKREGKPVPVDGPGFQIFTNAVDYFK